MRFVVHDGGSFAKTARGQREPRLFVLRLAAAVLCIAFLFHGPAHAAEGPTCAEFGAWLDPASGAQLAPDALTAGMAARPVVLLGEQHDNAEHHRWQLHTLAALHGRRPDMVIGFEMFPRRVQASLDDWVAGKLDVEGFLEASEWQRVWGFDPELYLPLFHFARQNRVPMVAMNVDRALVSRVGDEGWAAVPEAERAELSDPRPASAAYRQSLAEVYREHLAESERERDLEAIMAEEAFGRFVEAQLTWDRAMAEALVEARGRHPEALLVGIVGRGHIEHGHGIPHQLEDLGEPGAAVLIPLEAGRVCEAMTAGLADAVFLVASEETAVPAPPKPRLGVRIENAERGARILSVSAGSVAEASDLRSGDVIVQAAGLAIGRVDDLIAVVQRQAPGTWLPLTIRRDGEDQDLVAKFPTAAEAAE